MPKRGFDIEQAVIAGNDAVAAFYERIGYLSEPRLSFGKRLAGEAPRGE